MVVVLERGEWWILLLGVEGWEVVLVLFRALLALSSSIWRLLSTNLCSCDIIGTLKLVLRVKTWKA